MIGLKKKILFKIWLICIVGTANFWTQNWIDSWIVPTQAHNKLDYKQNELKFDLWLLIALIQKFYKLTAFGWKTFIKRF